MAQEDVSVRKLRRSECGSLCGYLYHRTGGGLSLFWPRRRHWYVLEDWRLLSYKTREDADPASVPLALIDLRDVAISVVPHETNQFKLVTGDKEHLFTAESHESMMIWMVGLQARREARLSPAAPSEGRRHSAPVRSRSLASVKGVPGARRSPPWSTWTPQLPWRQGRRSPPSPGQTHTSTRHTASYNNHTRWRQETFQKSFKTTLYKKDPDWQSSKTRRHAWCVSSHQYSTLSSSYDHDDSLTESSPEDVFMFDDRLTPPRESSQLGVTGIGQVTKNCRERFKHPTLRSLSLDSAVDNDSGIVVAPVSGQQADLQYNLTSVKLALTQALEREALLQSRLDQKETKCIDNEEKVRWLQSCQGSRGENRVLEEKLRVLQRENEFLDEEVRQLVDVQRQQKLLHKDQQRKINDMEMEIEKRKLNYVFLLQSLITMPTGDPHDGLEVKLFGGTAHRESIEKLLEEARTTNPALPNYHRLSRDGVHTDCYGFKHHFRNEGLLLHYLCQHLVVHYTRRLASSRENETKWHRVLRSKFLVRTSVLKTLCRGGIPHHLRPAVWQKLVHTQVADIMAAKGDRYFSHLVNMAQDSQHVSRYRKQISLDLLRTMPENFNYSDADSDGIQSMTMVLQAFCIHSPVLGYCQGMNFIVAFFLLFLNTEDSFWALVAITERFFAVNYFDHNLSGAQVDQDVLKDLMKEKLPYLHRHFSRLHVDISSITLNWFLTLFINAVPFLTQLRIWDCFLLEGPKVLFRFSLAVLKWNESVLLQKTDMLSTLRHLKACTNLMFDANTLVKLAFEDMQPFAHRHQLASKQLLYLDRIKASLLVSEDKHRRLTSQEEKMLDVSDVGLLYECTAHWADGEVWVCETDTDHGDVSVISCDKVLVTSTHIKVNSRIMCALAVGDVFLLGTLTWKLLAYSFQTRKKVWCQHLHDSVLCLQSSVSGSTVFAGLADGTLAVLEDVNLADLEVEPLYIPIGRLPVTSLVLVGDKLWLSCGSVVHILSSRTLDTLHKITISDNTFDHIRAIVPSKQGVWLAILGTTVLQLWDQQQLTRQLCVDIATNTCYKERQCQGEQTRDSDITAVLMVDTCVWVGTRDGHLYVYHVTHKRSRPSGQAVSVQRRCLAKCSTSTRSQGNIEVEGKNAQNHQVTEGHLGENSAHPLNNDVISVNPDIVDWHPEVSTTCNGSYGISPPATVKREHSFLVPLRRLALPRVSLIKGDSVLYSPSEDSPDTSPEIIETPFYKDTFSFTFDDKLLLSSSPEKCTDHQDKSLELILKDQPKFCSSKTSSSSVTSLVHNDRCVDDITNDKAVVRSDEICQDVAVESQLKDSFTEEMSKVKVEQRPWLNTRSPKRSKVKLALVTKMKISDKPVRSLVQTSCHRRPVVISCAGCHGDQRSLLKWRRRSDEKTWASEPVLNEDHCSS